MNGMQWRRVVSQSRIASWIALALAACGSSDPSNEDSTGETQAAASKQLADHTAGQACDSDKDCANGSCEQELRAFPFLSRDALAAPGGFCTFPCRINADCGEGGVCIGSGANALSFNEPDERGLCLAFCDASTPCREGYACLDLFGQPLGSEDGTGANVGTCQPLVESEPQP